MKILLYSPAFSPSVGGLESVVEILATEFQRAGHAVTVVTTTPADGAAERFPFVVVRRPGPLHLFRLVRWSDVFFHANVSLKGLWPLLLVRRPWVVSHNSWYRHVSGRITWRDRLKQRTLRWAAASIAASSSLAEHLETPAVVICNPYRQDLFYRRPEIERSRDLLFVGRLVSDKGCDVLLDALAEMEADGLRPDLTIVGIGPEEGALRAQARRLGLSDRVVLAGLERDERLAETLNRHRLLVVPSRYDEPFGIVALEGLACGCTVVATRGGGLREAVGPGGWTVANGDAHELAGTLAAALRDELPPPDPEGVSRHLVKRTAPVVAAHYLEVLERAVYGTRRSGVEAARGHDREPGCEPDSEVPDRRADG